MPVPAKKLKALADEYKAKKKGVDAEEEEKDDGAGEDDEGPDDSDVAKFVDEEGEKVNDGKQDPQLRKLMRNFDPDDNPPEWVRDESKWERAKEAVDPEGEGAEKYDEPYAVVAHVYKRMGGRIGGGGKKG